VVQITKGSGKLIISLDSRHSLVSSILHNKIEIHKDGKYLRDFTNLYSAYEYYLEHTEKD
jgi:hypothetical protein